MATVTMHGDPPPNEWPHWNYGDGLNIEVVPAERLLSLQREHETLVEQYKVEMSHSIGLSMKLAITDTQLSIALGQIHIMQVEIDRLKAMKDRFLDLED